MIYADNAPCEVTCDYIENVCDDLKNALTDFLENEYSDEGYDSVGDLITHVSVMLDFMVPDDE